MTAVSDRPDQAAPSTMTADPGASGGRRSPDRLERRSAAQQRRAAARTRDLTALLRQRPELAGVHAPADFAVDSARWCV